MQKYIAIKDGGPYAALKLAAYYAQRVCTSRRLRRLATRAAVAGLKLVHGRPPRQNPLDLASADTLRMQGFVRLRRLLSSRQCADILAYLRHRNMIAVRGNGASFCMDSVPAGICTADYPSETVVNCPHVMELANHPDVLAIAARYLGYTPTITLISMRWSFPGEAVDIDVQGFHRDAEAGCIKMLVYLTDVDEDAGPHRYVAGSHRDRMPIRLHRYPDCEVNIRYGGSIGILGPAGTAFVIDSKGIHKGTPPALAPRLLLGIQYSLLPCPIYEYSPVTYTGSGRFNPYINRLMIKTGSRPNTCKAPDETMMPLAE
jgi:Phytanoyl-CoA dioxygenase (PhyH)